MNKRNQRYLNRVSGGATAPVVTYNAASNKTVADYGMQVDKQAAYAASYDLTKSRPDMVINFGPKATVSAANVISEDNRQLTVNGSTYANSDQYISRKI